MGNIENKEAIEYDHPIPRPYKPPKTNDNLLCKNCKIKKVPAKFQIISMNICKNCYKIEKKNQYNWYINNDGNPNDISKILPNLYLGGRDAAKCEDELLKIGITNILCVGYFLWELYPNSFKYKTIEIGDDENEYIIPFFYPAISFINSGKKCFVHCVRGFSRSATFVIAYVMFNFKMNFDKAYDLVYKKRNLINPNDGFIKQLKEFEEILIICKYREDLVRNLYLKSFQKIKL
jgi:protein-tyrosine phosphatase